MLPHVSAQAETTENLGVGAACSAPDLVGSWRTSSRCCGRTGGWGLSTGEPYCVKLHPKLCNFDHTGLRDCRYCFTKSIGQTVCWVGSKDKCQHLEFC
jgi:hypothetical protein